MVIRRSVMHATYHAFRKLLYGGLYMQDMNPWPRKVESQVAQAVNIGPSWYTTAYLTSLFLDLCSMTFNCRRFPQEMVKTELKEQILDLDVSGWQRHTFKWMLMLHHKNLNGKWWQMLAHWQLNDHGGLLDIWTQHLLRFTNTDGRPPSAQGFCYCPRETVFGVW